MGAAIVADLAHVIAVDCLGWLALEAQDLHDGDPTTSVARLSHRKRCQEMPKRCQSPLLAPLGGTTTRISSAFARPTERRGCQHKSGVGDLQRREVHGAAGSPTRCSKRRVGEAEPPAERPSSHAQHQPATPLAARYDRNDRFGCRRASSETSEGTGRPMHAPPQRPFGWQASKHLHICQVPTRGCSPWALSDFA